MEGHLRDHTTRCLPPPPRHRPLRKIEFFRTVWGPASIQPIVPSRSATPATAGSACNRAYRGNGPLACTNARRTALMRVW
jgi:hypothetical protein